MKIFLKKIFFYEILLLAISIFITLFIINFLIYYKKIKEENLLISKNLEIVINNYKNNKKNTKIFYPYLIVNHDTVRFNKILDKYKITPLSSISNKNISLCNENGIQVNFKSDIYGFRNDNSVYLNSSEKIVLLGDSFIFGFCHNDNKTISNIINQNLEKKNILNLSQAGTGPLIQSAILIEYSKNINFQKLYWFLFTGNDFVNLSDELKNKNLNKYLDINYSQNLIKKQKEIDKIYIEIKNRYFPGEHLSTLEELEEIKKRYPFKKIELLSLFKMQEVKILLINFFDKENVNSLDKNLVNKYLDIVINTKNNLLDTKDLTIVILPEERSFKLKNFENYYHLNHIKKTLRDNSIDVVDLSSKFTKYYEFFDFFYSRYTHYNENAQILIANEILQNIKK